MEPCRKPVRNPAGKWYSEQVSVYQPRSIEPLVQELLAELPALMLVGPRGSGKTTMALRHAASVVRLDHPGEAGAFAGDPDAALRGRPEPIVLDEWQLVPEVLGAVKRAVDNDFRPGRFLLTGSVSAEFGSQMWPGTGRVVPLRMYGFTVAEQLGRSDVPTLVDRLVSGPLELGHTADLPDLRGYVELALRSGFPDAAFRDPDARARWLEGYVDQLVARDAQSVEPRRDANLLRRYFEAYALNTAGVVADQTLFEAAGINRKTAAAYEHLLARMYVIDSVPAWSTNRLRRLVRSPKRYVVDPALLVGLLRLDVEAVLADGDLMGRVLDTFVAAQLRADEPRTKARPRLYHLREEKGRHEIDLVIEIGARNVIAIEIKAGAAVKPHDARHLAWLRDQLGDAFIAGVVLHTGPYVYPLGDRLTAAPIATLWA